MARHKSAHLTDDQVITLRTSGMSDSHWGRLWGKPRQILRLARIGYTFKGHPTPPDQRPRRRGGRYADGTANLAIIPLPPSLTEQAIPTPA